MSNIIKGITQEDPITKKEPEVHVPGYGTIPLEMLKRHVQSLSKDFDTLIQQGAFLKAAYRSEQFYNALMALAKALPKPNKVDEGEVVSMQARKTPLVVAGHPFDWNVYDLRNNKMVASVIGGDRSDSKLYEIRIKSSGMTDETRMPPTYLLTAGPNDNPPYKAYELVAPPEKFSKIEKSPGPGGTTKLRPDEDDKLRHFFKILGAGRYYGYDVMLVEEGLDQWDLIEKALGAKIMDTDDAMELGYTDVDPEDSSGIIYLGNKKNEGYSAGAVGGSGIGEEVEEGLKSSIAAGILAGMGMIGSAQGQAADLSNFSTNYLQQVVKGEHPRPMVNIDDAKFELQQREQGKSTPSQSSTAKSTSSGFSNEYLKSVIDGTHPRPMISIEKAKEILKQRGVQEHINTPGGMGQSYRKFKPEPAGLDEAYRSMFYTMPPSLKDRKKLRAQGQRVPLRTYSELAQMLGISFDQLNGLRQKFPDFPKPVTGVAGARHGAIKYFKPDEFQVWLDKHNIKELLGLKKEVGEEQTPMFTPEEKMVNANDPKSDGWRLYKMKPAGTKESAIMKGITK